MADSTLHLAEATGQGGRAGVRARWLLLLSVGVTAALYLIPYGRFAAYPLVLLSTYAHEMGHGLAAVLMGAELDSLQLFADGSGLALIRGSSGRLASAVIAAGGLVGPSLLGALLFAASARRGTARAALGLLCAALLLSCVLVVRNAFGLAVAGLLGAGVLLVALKASPLAAQATCAFLAVQMALSVFSRADYLFTKTAMTADGAAPSDVANMAEALVLPYWFWGAACGLISLAVLFIGLRLFWRASGVGSRGTSTS